MKKIIPFILFFAITFSLSAQFMLPRFDVPQKLNISNNNDNEAQLVFYNNGNEMLYQRTYFANKSENAAAIGRDIWYSKVISDKQSSTDEGHYSKKWDDPYRLFRDGEVKGINDIVGVSPSGDTLYLINTIAKKDDFTRTLVSLQRKGKKNWSNKYTEINISGLDLNEGDPTIRMNESGDVLLFGMEVGKSSTNEDIFVSYKKADGSWSELIDLGDNINTDRYELAPFLSHDKKRLYFASNGYPGYGGSDIFMSTRLDDSWTNWSRPINLGDQINTKDYEIDFVITGDNEVYFTSDKDSKVENIYTTKITGEYLLENIDSINARLYNNATALPNQKLSIFDAKGGLMAFIVTNADGRFNYMKLKSDAQYLIKSKETDNEKLIGSKLYTNVAGNAQKERFIYTDKDYFQGDKEIRRTEIVNGKYTLQGKKQAQKWLVVVDENDFDIDTIQTDENGKFSFKRNVYDENLNMRPLNLKEKELEKVDLYAIDANGKRSKTFLMTKSLADNSSTSSSPSKPIKKDDDSSNDQGGDLVYFDFNTTSLNNEAKTIIKALVKKMKDDNKQKIELIGHTDAISSAELNMQIGKERATSVANYLKDLGINDNQIQFRSEGEVSPIASNNTEEGRAKNRRVRIILQ